VADAVDREWIIAAAFRLKAAADALWQRVQRFYAELLRTEGLAPPDDPRRDREYFRQRMAEARQRRREERMRRVAEMLAARSGPVALDGPLQIDAIPGLTEALDSFVGLPIPAEVLVRFAHRSDFDLDRYQRHVLAHASRGVAGFEAISGLIEDARRDRVYRFIAVVFLAHARRVEVWQEGDRIWVRRRETYEQGQGVSGRAAEAA